MMDFLKKWICSIWTCSACGQVNADWRTICGNPGCRTNR